MKLLGIKQYTTAPYYPVGNALCEHANRTILTMLKKVCHQKLESVRKIVLFLVSALNSTPQRALDYHSPFEVLYGLKPSDPIGFILGHQKALDPDTPVEIHKYVAYIDYVHKLVKQHTKQYKKKYLNQFNKSARPYPYKIGERVMKRVFLADLSQASTKISA